MSRYWSFTRIPWWPARSSDRACSRFAGGIRRSANCVTASSWSSFLRMTGQCARGTRRAAFLLTPFQMSLVVSSAIVRTSPTPGPQAAQPNVPSAPICDRAARACVSSVVIVFAHPTAHSAGVRSCKAKTRARSLGWDRRRMRARGPEAKIDESGAPVLPQPRSWPEGARHLNPGTGSGAGGPGGQDPA